MAHLNLYLADDVAEKLKQQARAAGLPLSRFLSSLLPERAAADGWPGDFFEQACGFLSEDMEEPEDRLPERLGALELP